MANASNNMHNPSATLRQAFDGPGPGRAIGRRRDLIATINLACALWFAPAARAAESGPPAADAKVVQFAIVTDLHIDPFLSPEAAWAGLTHDLKESDWNGIFAKFESGKIDPPDAYGRDASFKLIESALRSLATSTNLAFVICDGDLLAHESELNKYPAFTRMSEPDRIRFIERTEQLVLRLLSRELTNQGPIFPVLGNHDAITDYEEPDAGFLRSLSGAWTACLRSNMLSNAFFDFGCYSAPLPGVANRRILVFNSTVFRRGRPASPAAGGRNAKTLEWLERQLATASNSSVILAYHIPPGIDFHGSLDRSSPLEYWDGDDLAAFLKVLSANRAKIIASFCGHTHMDSFRLVHFNNSDLGLIHISPAITAIFGNNPAYQVVSLTPAGRLVDNCTYYLSNFAAISGQAWSPTVQPQWAREYSFASDLFPASLGVHDYSPQTLWRLTNTNPIPAQFTAIYDANAGREARQIERHAALFSNSLQIQAANP
jgi:hypothetical protein